MISNVSEAGFDICVVINIAIYVIFDVSLTVQHCVNVSAVVGVDAKLWSVDDVTQCEDRIVSQWREVSADEKHEMRDKVDEILRPFGFETRLLVIDRANSIALYFICLTLSAVMGLRDQWRNGQLCDIVQSLFTFLSGGAVGVTRLTWPAADYERCSELFTSSVGKPTI